MKVKSAIHGLLWLICTYWLTACAYEGVKSPVDASLALGKEVSYEVTHIDEDFSGTQRTPFAGTKNRPQPSLESGLYDYVVGAGDSLLINLYVVSSSGESGLTRIIPQAPALPSENKFLVGADGTITVPYAGKLKVGGKAFGKVKKQVHRAMRKYFLDPQLEMTVADFASSRALVSGEVTKPQELMLSHKPLTVVSAITQAGGALPTADLRNAQITRANGTIEPVDVTALIYEGAGQYNQILLGGDTLHIPRNHANQVYVVGEAMDAKTLTMHASGMNLTEALGEVKGLNPETARPSSVYVLREYVGRLEDKRDLSIYHLDASDPKAYVYATKFHMQPQDVIFIGAQTITDWGRFITQLLPGGVAGLVQPAPYILN